MARFVDLARSGSWLTRQRVTVYTTMLLIAYAIVVMAMAVLSPDGRNDYAGRPLGTDFSNVYAAGTYVLDGDPSAAFDPARQHAREQTIFGHETPFYGWHYPPFFLGLAALLAMLPDGGALAVWQLATFAAYLMAIRAAVGETLARDRLWWMAAAAFPAVLVNLGHGHNGFLTTALLAGALVVLDKRPIVAGILIGLLAYKPQFGLLIPVVLLATGRWRTIAAASLTVGAMVAASWLAWGPSVWEAFAAFSDFTRVTVLEQGGTGWQKIQTVFSAVRMWGGTVELAYAAQAAATLVLAAALVVLWRSAADQRLKSAALCVAAILATPYSLDYDMMVLAAALAFVASYLADHDVRPWVVTLMVAVWVVPLLARAIAMITLVPIAVILMVVFFITIYVWSGAPRPAFRASNFFQKGL